MGRRLRLRLVALLLEARRHLSLLEVEGTSFLLPTRVTFAWQGRPSSVSSWAKAGCCKFKL